MIKTEGSVCHKTEMRSYYSVKCSLFIPRSIVAFHHNPWAHWQFCISWHNFKIHGMLEIDPCNSSHQEPFVFPCCWGVSHLPNVGLLVQTNDSLIGKGRTVGRVIKMFPLQLLSNCWCTPVHYHNEWWFSHFLTCSTPIMSPPCAFVHWHWISVGEMSFIHQDCITLWTSSHRT